MASNYNKQVEHQQAKYTGTGHADVSKHEWVTNHHRDMYASIVGHPTLTAFYALSNNQSLARTRYEMTMKMVLPCGPAPAGAAGNGAKKK